MVHYLKNKVVINLLEIIARLVGFEPTASASAGLRSIHLSYRRMYSAGASAEGGI